jgi:hypothetical protein
MSSWPLRWNFNLCFSQLSCTELLLRRLNNKLTIFRIFLWMSTMILRSSVKTPFQVELCIFDLSASYSIMRSDGFIQFPLWRRIIRRTDVNVLQELRNMVLFWLVHLPESKRRTFNTAGLLSWYVESFISLSRNSWIWLEAFTFYFKGRRAYQIQLLHQVCQLVVLII